MADYNYSSDIIKNLPLKPVTSDPELQKLLTPVHIAITELANNASTPASFVGFSARLAADQVVAGTIVFGDVAFAGGYNSGNYNAATGVFTAPSAGKYLVLSTGLLYNGGAVLDWDAQLEINGAVAVQQDHRTDAAVTDAYVVNLVLNLAAGDTVEIACPNLAAAVPMRAGATFSVEKL